jgi:hypothetical protein
MIPEGYLSDTHWVSQEFLKKKKATGLYGNRKLASCFPKAW